MAEPVCADRCDLVAALVAEVARLKGVPLETARIGWGLTSQYTPLTGSPTGTTGARCAVCGHHYAGRGALTAARECADFDTGTTD